MATASGSFTPRAALRSAAPIGSAAWRGVQKKRAVRFKREIEFYSKQRASPSYSLSAGLAGETRCVRQVVALLLARRD